MGGGALVLAGALGLAVWRYGVATVSLFLAPLFTVVAVFCGAWLAGVDPHSPQYVLLMQPWATGAVLLWVTFALAVLLLWLGSMPAGLAGRAWRDGQRPTGHHLSSGE